MPLFFIMSGFVFSVKDNLGHHILHICRTLVVPYIFFNLFTIFLQQMLPFFSVEERGVARQIKIMILNGGNLWFIYVLIEFRLLFYFIDKVIRKRISYGIAGLVISIVLATVQLPAIKYFLFSSFITYAPFFMLGYCIKSVVEQNPPSLSKKKKLYPGVLFLIIQILLFYLKENFTETFLSYYPLYFLLALSGCIVSYCLLLSLLDRKIKNVFSCFGKVSFQMYIFNGYFISVSRTLLVAFFHTKAVLILAILNFIIGLIPNYYFSFLILKLKPVRYLFGKEK